MGLKYWPQRGFCPPKHRNSSQSADRVPNGERARFLTQQPRARRPDVFSCVLTIFSWSWTASKIRRLLTFILLLPRCSQPLRTYLVSVEVGGRLSEICRTASFYVVAASDHVYRRILFFLGKLSFTSTQCLVSYCSDDIQRSSGSNKYWF